MTRSLVMFAAAASLAMFAAETGTGAGPTGAAPVAVTPTEFKTKISLSSFNPKKIHALPKETQELVLGTIIGIATGIKKGFQQDGVTPFEGLKGNFEIEHADGKREASGVAYLPEAFMDPILDLLSDEYGADPTDPTKEILVRKAVPSVQMAFVVKAFRADNAAGYSWAITPIGQVAQNDPLAALRALRSGPDASKLLGKAETIEGVGKAPKAAVTA